MKKVISIFLILLLSLMIVGCNGNKTEEQVEVSNVEEVEVDEANDENIAKDAQEGIAEDNSDAHVVSEEITITHKLGETTFMTNPETVVIMDFGILDILSVVGLEDRVVGLPKAHLPTYLAHFEDDKYVDLGNLVEANFEELNKLKPDLIIIPNRFTDSYDEFCKIAPTLFVEMPARTYVETFEENIDILAQVFPLQANELHEKFEVVDKQIAEVAEMAAGKTALLIQTNDDAVSVFGLGSRYAAIYTTFGFTVTDESIEQSTHGQAVSFEYVAEQNPEYLFIIDRSAAIAADGVTGAQVLMDNELVNGVDAVKNDRVAYLNSTNWYLVAGGINSTLGMIEEIREVLMR